MDTLGFDWFRKVFNPHSNRYKQGTYQLLIMDSHGSHKTFEFDIACKELNIISIYMPLHSSHLLQPLDVGLFSLLKKMYTKELKNTFQLIINHVNKLEFLETYKQVQFQVFIKSNILSVFKSAGIFFFDFTTVLDFLNTSLRFITFENKHNQIQQQNSLWTPQTFLIIKQLNKQKQMLDIKLKNHMHRLFNFTNQFLEQVIKACQTAMIGVTILAAENLNSTYSQWEAEA